MKKDKLHDMMARRSPLAPREAVAPVDIYGSQGSSDVDISISGQADKAESTQTDTSIRMQKDKSTSPQVHLSTEKQVDKMNGPQVDIDVGGQEYMSTMGQMGQSVQSHRRYTTYLTPETIKAVKREAFDGEKKDYEVVQRALDEYFRRRESGRA